MNDRTLDSRTWMTQFLAWLLFGVLLFVLMVSGYIYERDRCQMLDRDVRMGLKTTDEEQEFLGECAEKQHIGRVPRPPKGK